MTADAAVLTSGDRLGDRYEVEARLGSGGMGTVYRVRHLQLGTLHALKVLATSGDEVRERLLAEGRLQGALHHPGVVRVTDLVDVQGQPALVLELVRGRSLAEHLADGPLPRDQVDDIVPALLQAVAAAHAHGLVHRDLKPANILLEEVDGRLRPKVADFGLAKALDTTGSGRTATGAVVGTPAYMAPEQFRDASRVDARADVFSLGAVLYELVTGARPFSGTSATEVMWQTSTGSYVSLRDCVDAVPEPWEAAIVGALQPSPDHRIGSVAALREVWLGTRAPPEPAATDDPWSEGSLHPPVEALVEASVDPEVARHLEACARCRIDRRLYLESFEDRPIAAAPSAWRAGAMGALVGALLAPALLAGALGGLGQLADLGPWQAVLWALAVFGGARLALAVARARVGALGTLVDWYAPAVGVVSVGAVASALGAGVAARALAAAEVPRVPLLSAQAGVISLGAWWAAWVIGSVLLLVSLGVLVALRREASASPGFDPVPAGVALMGGGALWVLEASVATAEMAGLVTFLGIAAVGLLLASLPDEGPEDVRARWLAAYGAVLLGGGLAVAMRVWSQRALLAEVRTLAPGPAVAGAATFEAAWAEALGPWVPAWWVVAVLVAGSLLLRTSGVRGAGAPGLRHGLAGAVLLSLAAGSSWWATVRNAEVAARLLPGWRAAAVVDVVPALHLQTVPVGLTVAEGSAAPLRVGDQVVAVGGRAVHDLEELLAVLPAEPPEALSLTVERDGRLRELTLRR